MTIRPDSEISSPIQIMGLINRLEDWRGNVHQHQIKRRLHLKAPDQVDQQLVKDLRSLHVKAELDDATEVDALIATIKDWLKQAPVVHLTFSTPPARSVQDQIIDWLHKELDPNMLVDFEVDGSIAAGFVLRTKNHTYNFTANQLLWQGRARLAELVQHV